MKRMKLQFGVSPFFFLVLVSILFACGEDQKQENAGESALNEDYDQFQGFNMRDYDIPITLMLPDETANIGASTKPEVIHPEDGYKWEIKVGNNFSLFIEDWGDVDDRIESRKKELKDLPFYEIKYLVDEPDFIMYEQNLKVDGNKNAAASVGVPHKSYHVYGQKEINGITYLFQSREEGCEKLIIELMGKSIRSVQPIKDPSANS